MQRTRVVKITKPGGPEVLELAAMDLEDPGPDEVCVEVAAAGLNRADCLQRRGFYPAPPGVPADVPGLEFAGVVHGVGTNVSGWQTGDQVMGIVAGGGMATHLNTRADELLRVPDGLSLEQAAAIPEVFLTAYDAAVLQGGLAAGQTLLVHAVASGVGTAAIQLAKLVGAACVGTSRTAEKLARCKELGLEHGVLVEEGAFADKVRALAPDGVNVVLDTVGAAYLGDNIKVLALKGTIVVIGLMGGAKGQVNLGALLAKRGAVVGSVLRSRPAEEKAALARSFERHALKGFADGALRPVVDEVLPMSEISEAHRRMDANETFGKLVLTW